MLRSVKQLYRCKLVATGGEIGRVKDFYFDDQSWVVRYLVADTGSWLPGRQVLLSPRAFGSLDPVANILHVTLTQKQIEDSPPIETHKPVSRQYEEDYHRYYGWPFYWEGSGLWGMSGFPILELPPTAVGPDLATATGHSLARGDAHLRSAHAVNGYHIQASDGPIGHICDFMMDPKNWAICQLVIKTGHRFSGREVQIPTAQAYRISYEESCVFVHATSQDIERSPAHDPNLAAMEAGIPS